MNGVALIKEIAEIFEKHAITSEIIAASIRNTIHVIECAKAGAHIATIPYNVLDQMIKHPLTVAGIEKFKQDYLNIFSDK